MSVMIDVRCPSCGFDTRMEYCLLGSLTACPGCRAHTVADVPANGTYPVRRWELSYRDFSQLTGDPAYRLQVAPLLSSWFGYSIIGTGTSSRIVDVQGGPLDPLSVHLGIQGDEEKQHSLYQTAMTLWR